MDNAREQAEDRQAEANRASEEYGNAIELLDLVKAEHGRDVESAETVTERLMGLGSQSNSAAGACELEKPHRAAVARAELPQPSDLAMIDAAETLITKACNDRRADIWLLRDLNAKIDSSRQEWRKSLDRRDEQAGSVEESMTAVRAGDQALVQALHDLSAAYYEWFRSLVLLKPLTPEDVLAAIPAWSDETFPPSDQFDPK